MRICVVVAAVACAAVGCQTPSRVGPAAGPAQADLPYARENLTSEMGDLWQTKVKEFRADNQTRESGGTVFCGDSITAGFPFDGLLPEYRVANRGIGGDTLWGLIRRLDVSAYDLQPRRVFVMIGINDIFINRMAVPEYRQLYDYLFGELRRNCPRCKLYVQSVLPVRGRIANLDAADLNARVREINTQLQVLARRHGATYIDLCPDFCDVDGEMRTDRSSDGVHPNDAGYQVWADRVRPFLGRKP